MNQSRKSVAKLQKIALRKCQQFWMDAVHVYCTPAEYIALCYYFETKPRDLQYYMDLVKKGTSGPATHYIHVKRWGGNVFSKHPRGDFKSSYQH